MPDLTPGYNLIRMLAARGAKAQFFGHSVTRMAPTRDPGEYNNNLWIPDQRGALVRNDGERLKGFKRCLKKIFSPESGF